MARSAQIITICGSLLLAALHASGTETVLGREQTTGVWDYDRRLVRSRMPHYLWTNCVAWYTFNRLGAYALVGTNNGTATGAAWSNNLDGAYGSYYFDGSDDIINFNDSDAWTFTSGTNDSPCTWSFWVKPGPGGPDLEGLLNKAGSAVGSREWVVYGYLNSVRIYLFDGSTNYLSAFTATTWTTNVWGHYVWTYDGTRANTGLTLYRDGVIVGGLTRSTYGVYLGQTNSTHAFQLGQYRDIASTFYSGLLDEVALFDRALASNEVYNLYLYGTTAAGGAH